jgi:transcriptional regulator
LHSQRLRGDPFARFSAQDVRALISAYPLAWVIAPGAGEASLLPLVADAANADAAVTERVGHLARSNPLYRALCAASRALILFQGPQCYISPDQVGRRDWAPV